MVEAEQTIRVITFSGKKSDWPIWSEKFLARVKRKGYKDILTGAQVAPKDDETIDLKSDEGSAKLKLKEMNELAFEDLIISISGDNEVGRVAFQIVRGSKTQDYLGGDAHLAWDRLLKKYAARTAPSRLNLRNQLTKCVLKSTREDPDVWITTLEDLRSQLLEAGAMISEEDILEHALNNLPREYELVVSKLEDRLGLKENPLTIDELRDQLNLRFERLGNKKEESIRGETALFAGGFKGKCRKCGKWGHKGKDCKSSPDGSGVEATSFSGMCFYCKKKGHRIQDCRKKKAADERLAAKESSKSTESSHVALMVFDPVVNAPPPKTKPKPCSCPCSRQGHPASKCAPKHLKTSRQTSSEASLPSNLALSAHGTCLSAHDPNKSDDQIFIADSGASCHMVHSDVGLFNWKPINETITIGNGQAIYAKKMGCLRGLIIQQDGTQTPVVLENVKFVPELAPYNLFSIPAALDKGFSIGNTGKTITLTKDKVHLLFDHEITTQSGWVGGFSFSRDTALVAHTPRRSLTSEQLHGILGHPSPAATIQTANYYNQPMKGALGTCESCALSKARQRNLPNHSHDAPSSLVPGEKLSFDISSIATESLGGARFWLLVIDHETDFCWSFFLARKNDAKKHILKLLFFLRQSGYHPKVLRCDNAGENKSVQTLCQEKNFPIKFEFTAPNTPQQNGKVERKFATLYGRVRAMLNGAGVPEDLRKRLWAECASTATYCDNITVPGGTSTTPYHRFWTRDPDRPFNSLRTFGEIAIVTSGLKLQGKLSNKGFPAMFLGYAADHASDTYRLLNLDTDHVVFSRDLRWLNLNYGHWAARSALPPDDLPDDLPSDTIAPRVSFAANDEVSPESEAGREEAQPPGHASTPKPLTGMVTRSRSAGNLRSGRFNSTGRPESQPRLNRELTKLQTYYNPTMNEPSPNEEPTVTNDPTNTVVEHETTVETVQEEPDVAHLGLSMMDGTEFALFAKEKLIGPGPTRPDAHKPMMPTKTHILDQLEQVKASNTLSDVEKSEQIKTIVAILKEDIPENFQAAYNHPDPKLREFWRAAIRKEFHDMNMHRVWRKVKRRDVPQNRRCIKCKWIFDVKRDGRFRARLVGCGYSQIPGVDFQETYSPVINDITWRILIIEKILRKYHAKIADVETAFLYGSLEEEIYMEPPPGYQVEADECVLLEKALYGLVQAARQYYKKFMNVLKELGFSGGKADPCLMTRRNEKGVVHIAVWVDDSLLVGDATAIDNAIDDLQKAGFVLKVTGSLDDYLSCEITFSDDESVGWIRQPHLLKKMERRFANVLKGLRKFRTPATPGLTIMRQPNFLVTKEEHRTYRSGVGMLLYLVKHTRPDLANAVRELTKVLDGPSPAAYKELLRTIKYVLDTKDMCLKIRPETDGEMWRMTAYSDSDWASDPESRVSVSGFVLYLCGVPISWKSKGQKSVSLSSTEAEFVALSETAKEIKFVYQVLVSMGLNVQLPIIVHVDNVGAIFMSETVAVSQRTKHVDVRYRFINEFVEDGFLKVVFVRTRENDADMFTKNLGEELHSKHTGKMVEIKIN